MKIIALAALVMLPAYAQAQPYKNPFDLQKGCELVAQRSKNLTGMDAANAAYCLGMIDGAAGSVTYNKLAPSELPKFCPNERMEVYEVAAKVANTLKHPNIAKYENNVRGGPLILALSIHYPCK